MRSCTCLAIDCYRYSVLIPCTDRVRYNFARIGSCSRFRMFEFVFVFGFTVFVSVFVFKCKNRKQLSSISTEFDRFHPYARRHMQGTQVIKKENIQICIVPCSPSKLRQYRVTYGESPPATYSFTVQMTLLNPLPPPDEYINKQIECSVASPITLRSEQYVNVINYQHTLSKQHGQQ